MKVLVLDTVHGGKIIAESYLKKKNEVTVVDVYKVTHKEVLSSLRHRGAKVADEAPAEHFDVVVMPCHCPDSFLGACTYDRRMTFSEAVNELCDDRRFRIEITGSKGKTSACYLLAHVLSAAGKKTFLHTSAGLGPYIGGKQIVTDFQSIAPSTLLALPKGEYEVLVCETSLGGSGKADIAAITNLDAEFGIAKNTHNAEFGMNEVLTKKGVTFVRADELGIWSKYGTQVKAIGDRVEIAGEPEFGKPIKVNIDYRGKHEVELSGKYLALQYLDAISLVLEICEFMDVPAESVVKALGSFCGAPGRGEVRSENGVRYVHDLNPDVSHSSVRYVLGCMSKMNALADAVLVVDPATRKVCSKLDREAIEKVAAEFNVPAIFTDGVNHHPSVEGKGTVIWLAKEGYQ